MKSSTASLFILFLGAGGCHGSVVPTEENNLIPCLGDEIPPGENLVEWDASCVNYLGDSCAVDIARNGDESLGWCVACPDTGFCHGDIPRGHK